MKKYNIFIFRRDLRIVDNTTLNYLLDNKKNIIPIFVFTPEQVKKNPFISTNAIQFMIESLKEVNIILKKNKSKLHIFQGENLKIVKKICDEINVESIAYNKDYTPYAIKRDKEIEDYCLENNIECISHEDYLLSKIGDLNKADGKPYTVFTPFRNNGFKYTVLKPKSSSNLLNLTKFNFDFEKDYIENPINLNILVHGGRKNGIKQLDKVNNQSDYNQNRNMTSVPTSHLSAYIKFGCISIREVYWKIRNLFEFDNELLSQLFWREFYFYIVYYFPRVLKGKNYNEKYDNIKWTNDTEKYLKWCRGETGYPIVDAGLRELNKTGYMHNRSRLITSNFLNRMLGMDWRLGEKYFANKLTDYDPSVNNGNWQWIASTGVDPKPYFQRLFNPWLQSKKYDPNAEYIKKWIPALKDIPAKELHEWDKYCKNYNLSKLKYLKPIVEYKKARELSVKMYREK